MKQLFFRSLAAVSLSLSLLGWVSAEAQSFTLLHTFTGGVDGSSPNGGLSVAGSTQLYGTTYAGGPSGQGTVFKLSQKSGGWSLSPLYAFSGGSDGGGPLDGVTVGPSGALYGATSAGGSGSGVVFELQPPLTICVAVHCAWKETVLHAFTDGADGGYPAYGNVILDREGNVYGTTLLGGASGVGTAYQLSHSGGQWTETVLHSFGGGDDGFEPEGGMVFDGSGNLYGTTLTGGANQCEGSFCGVVYQLVPQQNGTWLENILFNLNTVDSGSYPFSTPVFDASGHLFGTTSSYGQNNGGTVFEMTNVNGWTFSPIYQLPSGNGTWCSPYAGVTVDSNGKLFGVCYSAGQYGQGLVFELSDLGGQWTFTDLHDFTGGADGAGPVGPVLVLNGNLYGTTAYGGSTSGNCGSGGCGVVWEIAGVAR